MPFRCLDSQYRRELVRVYLTNVEGICRRFVEEKREALTKVKSDMAALRDFWNKLDKADQLEAVSLKGSDIHKVCCFMLAVVHITGVHEPKCVTALLMMYIDVSVALVATT